MKRSDIDTATVLMACHISSNGGSLPAYDMLVRKFCAPSKVVIAAINRDIEKGYIDYGTSLRTCFLTKEGKDKLQEYAHRVAEGKIDEMPLEKWSKSDNISAADQEKKFKKIFNLNEGDKVIYKANKSYIEKLGIKFKS